MSEPLKASIAPDLDLGSGYVLQFTALDATTGAVVSGVTVSLANLTVRNVAGGPPGEILVPTDFEWLNLPQGSGG